MGTLDRFATASHRKGGTLDSFERAAGGRKRKRRKSRRR